MTLFIVIVLYLCVGNLYALINAPEPDYWYERWIYALLWPLDMLFFMYIYVVRFIKKIKKKL